MKVLGARWLVATLDYMSEKPQIIVNGCNKLGITGARDGIRDGDSGSFQEGCEAEHTERSVSKVTEDFRREMS